MLYKGNWYGVQTKDVDEQEGLVTVAVNGFNIMDSQGDISMPGSFKKTIKVKTNGKERTISLHIEGTVVPKGK